LERVRHASNQSVLYFEKGPTDEYERIAAKERRGQTMFHWPLEFPEVIVKRGGFDAFVGNPPFLGGSRISTRLGRPYFEGIRNLWGNAGRADLCAYFFLRSHSLVRHSGIIGLLATNTISQGDTREVGLDALVSSDASVLRGISSQKWPGTAALEVSLVWFTKCLWSGRYILDDAEVAGITAFLTAKEQITGNPHTLVGNEGVAFKGMEPNARGLLLDMSEAHALLKRNAKNAEVVLPYLTGDAFLNSPEHTPDQWVIDFQDWPLNSADAPPGYRGPLASDFPECIAIAEERAKPERLAKSPDVANAPWWRFWRIRAELRSALQEKKRILFHAFTSKYLAFAFLPCGIIYSSPHIVVVLDGAQHFAVLQSSLHEAWAFRYCSTHETRLRYASSDLFCTFPFPTCRPADFHCHDTEAVGAQYIQQRSDSMVNSESGLTNTYNRFHDPDKTDADIQKLRDLHVEMDQAVAAAYGWTDLELGHGFHETKQGVRFTISESARREVLQRLLKLNHERYAEEVKQGLHGKKTGKAKPNKAGKSTGSDQNTLF
jgi:hypothetical protein